MMKDARVTHIDLFGQSHPLCMTVSAYEEFSDQFGDVSSWLAALEADGGKHAVAMTVDFLCILMDGGRDRVETLCRLSGQKPELPARIEKNDLKKVITVGDLGEIQLALINAYNISNSQTVGVAEDREKNAETTQ